MTTCPKCKRNSWEEKRDYWWCLYADCQHQVDKPNLEAAHAQLVALVQKLPKVEGEINELKACILVRSRAVTYKMIADLLQARQALG